jgi:hypothetical protein
MLVGGAPRGLPGMVFDRVDLQRAPEGYPLDDVIVHAHDSKGVAAVLEVQVKRDITFAPADPVFKSVVEQIAKASVKEGFWDRKHELAIATAHASRQITGSYQDVLTWARELGSSAEFTARIERKGSANNAMRTFVTTFKGHLKSAGVAHENETVWRLLRRMQIHVYDFTAAGSASEELTRDRATQALHSEEASKSSALWKYLIGKAIEIAAAGGGRSRSELVAEVGQDFRLAGDRRFVGARAVAAEASSQALDEIKDQILNTSLGRLERLEAVRAAAEGSRYIEIRGDAGVGKSGVLKHFARQVGHEGKVFVASPARITPRGWTALRKVIGFDGTAIEFLGDLAVDGGGWLFVDNLDFYADDERTTINDLLRAATQVPGLIVIATARTRFGSEEPSWLPADALNRLGRAKPIVIGELAKSEVDELRENEPRLHSLLGDGHPAKNVTRNLFRLARLADMPIDSPSPRSEVDMLDLWWRTADGPVNETLRERSRLLRDLAALAMTRDQTFDVREYDSVPVDALIASETLRDHGNDRVAFQHDVLREWAIASRIADDLTSLSAFNLTAYAPAWQARGIELAARIHLEIKKDTASWRKLLDAVSSSSAHGAWRRAVLLSVVHSEIADELLTRLENELLADEAALLRELIPLVMAVDVQPLKEFYANAGLEVPVISDSLNFPNNASWRHLVSWTFELGSKLPPAAIPSVVELFKGWSIVGLMVPDPLTIAILPQMKDWLVEIEQASDGIKYSDRKPAFGGALGGSDLSSMEEDLRLTLALHAHRVPAVAQDYLRSVRNRRKIETIGSKILKFRGTFAQAAPEELASLTAALLIKPPSSERRRRDRQDDEALNFIDKQFIPESPAQGPFFELLMHAPKHGLALIRKLIDSAITFHTKGAAPSDDDTIVIETDVGPRRFLWLRTYGWSRSSHYFSITSALMALEAWSHGRIEKGEAPKDVIADIVGEGDVPAAYLLLVVDMVISHWPKTREDAIPFMTSPDLLAFDLGRPEQEQMEFPDIFGLKSLQKEPAGPKIEDLKAHASHTNGFDAILMRLGVGSWDELRQRAIGRLQSAIQQMGPYEAKDTLRTPRLMAVHALNLLDPANYRDLEMQDREGSKVMVKQFVAPEAEAKHFAALQQESAPNVDDHRATLTIQGVIDHPDRSSPEIAELVTTWAQRQSPDREGDDRDATHVVEDAIVGAAMIAMRDGSPEHRAKHRAWAEGIFSEADKGEQDSVRQIRAGMKFNPPAMIFAGRVLSLTDSPTPEALRRLFEMATLDPAAAHGALAANAALQAVDNRLPVALLRATLAASFQYWHDFEVSDVDKAADEELRQTEVLHAIDAEVAWLAGTGLEPAWPTFTTDDNRKKPRRRGFRIGGDTSEDKPAPRPKTVRYINHQAAALWVRSLFPRVRDEDRAAVREFCKAYADWTYATNGQGLAQDEQVGETPNEWNDAYFAMLANTLHGLPVDEVLTAIEPMTTLPEEQFYDVVADFVASLDSVFFNDGKIDAPVAFAVRQRLAQRLTETWGWKRLKGISSGVEIHLGPAAAVMFFCHHYFGQAPKSYLRPIAVERAVTFLPVLEALVASAPSPFIALAALSTVEVAPRMEQLSLVRALGLACLRAYPSDRQFWVDHGIGRRLCLWLEAVVTANPTAFSPAADFRPEVDTLLAGLVAIGVPEARRIEMLLPRD